MSEHMGNIKTKHLGGDSARMPSTMAGGHPVHKPGNADGTPASKMTWKGSPMNASKSAGHMKK